MEVAGRTDGILEVKQKNRHKVKGRKSGVLRWRGKRRLAVVGGGFDSMSQIDCG